MGNRLLWVVGLNPIVTLAVLAQEPDSVTRTTLQGAYTTDQARSGGTVFRQVCADCHAPARFRDSTFLTGWKGRPVRDLFELIRTQMPQDNPGGLRRAEYADVLAYIFELQGLPAGESALPSDDAALRRIRIEPK